MSCSDHNRITAVSPTDGSRLAQYTISGLASIGALAWDRGRNVLWACEGFGGDDRKVWKVDLATSSATYAFTSAGCVDGLSYDGTDDTLWTSADVSTTVSHYQSDGTLIGSHSVSGKLGSCGSSGIAIGGPHVFLANNGCQEIYVTTKAFDTFQLFGSYPARLEDLECDDRTFATEGKGAIWSKDAYDNVLNAFQADLSDCGFGGYGSSPAGGPLTAEETLGDGNASHRHQTQCEEGEPVNCATGNFWHPFQDLAIPARGPDLVLERTYNSLAADADGPFGFGWSTTYGAHLAVDGAGKVTVHQENGAIVVFEPDGAGGYMAAPRVMATLEKDASGYTFVRNKREHLRFNLDGRLLEIRDLNGYTVTLSHNATGQLTGVADASGSTLSFAYNAAGRVASVTDPANRTVSYGYDTAGNLTSVTDVAGGVTSFTYDTSHRLVTMADPRGGTVTNVYDAQSRVTEQTDALGARTAFQYGDSGTTITDPKGNVTFQEYRDGVLMALTRAKGTTAAATWKFTYDPFSLGIETAGDPNGHTTSRTYDRSGNLLSEKNALEQETTFTYGSLNELTSITDPSGVTTTLTYDANANLLSISRPLSGTAQTQTTAFSYIDASHPGDVTSITDPTNRTWQFTYNGAGNLASAANPAGHTTTYTYDAIGRRTSEVSPRGNVTGADPAQHTTTFTYNAFGDLTSITNPIAANVQRSYDANRNLASVTDPDANTTTYTYDADDRLTTIDRADTTRLTYGYDANDNITSQTDGAGNVTSYGFDVLDRVISMTDPLARTTSFGYDPAGNRTTITDPAGQTTTLAYDAANRVTGIIYSDGMTPNVTYSYDALGRRTAMTDGTGTSSYKWDSLDRLTATTNGNGQSIRYAYDLADRVTAITYPNGKTVTRDHDSAGRFSAVTDWLTKTTSFSYDPDGNLVGQSAGNGTTAAYTFDTADRLMAVDHTGPGGAIASFTYSRTTAGLLVSAATTGITQPDETYTYTPLDQLASVNAATYAYDPADNITKLISDATLAYDAANQLTSFTEGSGTTSFDYDTRGNRTRMSPPGEQPTSYVYDQVDRLTEVQRAGTDAYGVLDAGVYHSLALKSDGTAWAWGYNLYGQIGDGTTANRTTPVQVSGLTGATSIAAGGYHSLAAKSDGTAWAWGKNDSGELGNGTTSHSSAPVQVSNLIGVSDVDGGSHHSLALKADGTVWAWGTNSAGQLGDGTTTASTTPMQVQNLTGVTAIAAGGLSGYAGHNLALLPDGTVWTWGHNNEGQLGDGTTTNRSTPVQVSGLAGVVAVAANGNTSYALKADGTVWAWGDNSSGQLANNSVKQRATSPVQSNISGVAFIAAGAEHALAVRSDGTAWAWGNNEYGQLGNGTSGRNASTSTPVQVNNIAAINSLAGGHRHSLGALGDGTAWGWGLNNVGQVGDGTTTIRTSPVQITTLTGVQPLPSTTASYVYDGDGLRAAKTTSGQALAFAWDIAGPLPLVLTDGQTSYIYGPGELPLEQIHADGGVEFFHHDQLGSTRALSDATGTAVATFSYDPYGNETAKTGTAETPLRYAGQYTDDETGLIYLRARYYDPAAAQFITRDPVVGLLYTPYAYASGSPLNGADPTGLWPEFLDRAVRWVQENPRDAIKSGTIAVTAGVCIATAGAGCVITAVSGLLVRSGVTLTTPGIPGAAKAQSIGVDVMTSALTMGMGGALNAGLRGAGPYLPPVGRAGSILARATVRLPAAAATLFAAISTSNGGMLQAYTGDGDHHTVRLSPCAL